MHRRRRLQDGAGHVSIHASRCREAMRRRERHQPGQNRRFNPRLPLPGGDAYCAKASKRDRNVSIHASRCREAMRRWPRASTRWRLFQSTPPVAGRRCQRPAPRRAPHQEFQSTPPVAGRRCQLARRVACIAGGFNPRLPLPGGDATRAISSSTWMVVSIHASRCREAMPSLSARQSGFYPFQSTPPVAGRRCRFRSVARPSRTCFNPRLPLPGGDACATAPARRSCRLFQSTPPVAGRRCLPPPSRTPAPTSRFNPRLPLPGGDAPIGGDVAPRVRGFQSTPPVAGRRCHCSSCPTRRYRPFQSTPPVAGRRCLRRVFCRPRRVTCFNPRLPLPGGDARHGQVHRRTQRRFNPRLPLPGGDAGAVGGCGLGLLRRFQSTPPVAGRRCAQPRRRRSGGCCFNPRLPLPGGDAHPP